MTVSFQENFLVIDGQSKQFPWAILDAIELTDKVIVLFDPDSYLVDPNYKVMRLKGAPSYKNLIAFTKGGVKLWEAEFPRASDYYHRITSAVPLIVYSFSSYKCEIDPISGTIKSKEFYK